MHSPGRRDRPFRLFLKQIAKIAPPCRRFEGFGHGLCGEETSHFVQKLFPGSVRTVQKSHPFAEVFGKPFGSLTVILEFPSGCRDEAVLFQPRAAGGSACSGCAALHPPIRQTNSWRTSLLTRSKLLRVLRMSRRARCTEARHRRHSGS